jgi:hypothetical protein
MMEAHNTRRTTFTLAVDDFGVKCFSKAHADHLFSALKEKHDLTKDWRTGGASCRGRFA